MFGHMHKPLTEYSNHYVDWSRVGELLGSGAHRYSHDELLVRGGIIAFTAASAMLGAYLNDETKTGYGGLAIVVASGLLGFFVSHAVAIYPLVSKRMAMRQECDNIEASIHRKIDEMSASLSSDDRQLIQAVIDRIKTFSLTTDQRGNASQTWGTRKRLLGNFAECLDESHVASGFWAQKPSDIFDVLSMTVADNHVMVMRR